MAFRSFATSFFTGRIGTPSSSAALGPASSVEMPADLGDVLISSSRRSQRSRRQGHGLMLRHILMGT